MRQFKRSERIGSQILRDVQRLMEPECSANLKFLVTFTDVEVSEDLRYATIFYSVLGDEKEKKEAAGFLAHIRGRVQSDLGEQLRLKNTPTIKFKFDPSIERGVRIEQLLNEISRKNES